MESLTMILCAALPVLLGWTADRLFGDPEWLPHPIVGFGRAIAFGERRLNRGKNRILKGGVLAVGLIAAAYAVTQAVTNWLSEFPVAYVVAVSVGVFFFLAGRTLVDEVREVFRAVDRSVGEGRKQVSRIVGRDTASLDAQEIRTAALETLSENLSDGVTAPLFWYAVGGLPAMAAYKMTNTLDSMIGYRTERYALFGRVAARIDDAANYIPARLTALLMLAVSRRWDLLPFVRKYARNHLSPNSGWCEAALAGILSCRFGGTHDYFGERVEKPFIGDNPRLLDTQDMELAVKINRRTEVAATLIAAAVSALKWLLIAEWLR